MLIIAKYKTITNIKFLTAVYLCFIRFTKENAFLKTGKATVYIQISFSLYSDLRINKQKL